MYIRMESKGGEGNNSGNNLNSIFSFFSRKKKIEQVIQKEVPQIYKDTSLRSDGENYEDHKNYAKSIFGQIRSSSSSVIGIGGIRGSGKSSLAKNVMGQCAEKKYLTVAITSPTAYDPLDFLLTVYQNVCVTVKNRIDETFKSKYSIEEVGMNEARKDTRIFYIITFCAFVTIYSAFWALFLTTYKVSDIRPYVSDIQYKITEDSTELNDLDRKHIDSYKDVYNPSIHLLPVSYFMSKYRSYIYNSKATPTYAYAQIDDSLHSLDAPLLGYGRKLRYEYDSLNSVRAVRAKYGYSDSYSFSSVYIRGIDYSFFLLICGVGLMLILLAGWSVLSPWRKKTLLRKKYPVQRGLQLVTEYKLDQLSYQIKQTASAEISSNLTYLIPKMSKARELQARPLSLPGLTADFNDYLQDVAGVFGKVVICIDELDKILSHDDLVKLLSGIKGVLGQKGTYFILTVSEDAIAKFTSRFGVSRDLIESSFEETYYLKRVNSSTGTDIIKNYVYNAPVKDEYKDNFQDNCTLIWVFANGIPREIKRNVAKLARLNIDIQTQPQKNIWSYLWGFHLENMSTLAAKADLMDANAIDPVNFLISIDNLSKQKPESFTGDNCRDWLSNMVKLWPAKYYSPFTDELFKTEGNLNDKQVLNSYEKALLDTLFAAMSCVLTLDKSESALRNDYLATLDILFSSTSSSPLYMAYVFKNLLIRSEIIIAQATDDVITYSFQSSSD